MKIFFNKILSLLTKDDKKFLILLLFFSIFISLMETVGIAAIMPFITIANDFSIIHSNDYYLYVYNYFYFESDVYFVLVFGIALIVFYFLRSAINLYYFYVLSKFSKERYHFLAYRLLENYLGRDYKSFIGGNSSIFNKTIINEALNLTGIFSSLLFMISEVFIIIFIYSMMLYMNWKITLLLTIILVVNAFLLTKTISKKIKKEGSKREEFQKSFYEILNSTFGNFKMIKLRSNDKKILQEFSDVSHNFAKTNIISETLSHFPRLFLEALGFVIVIFIIVYFVYKNQQDISSIMALISMFILGLYRLMPSTNRLINGYNQIMFNYKSLDIIHNDLIYEVEELADEKIDYMHDISLNDISFWYVNEKYVLKDISLVISKGSKIAFIGESGGGKSTLIDIIMGLYKPISGNIFIDDKLLNTKNIKDWRKKIGYIPQSIYLFDGTVGENVAFDSAVDVQRVKDALKKANLLEFLEMHHDGIDTHVGENGIKLSGGQKQRVAIARALYNDPEILILDEATSALDNQTESNIMNEIYQITENKTLIIIAHRLSTIERCDIIYKLESGVLK